MSAWSENRPILLRLPQDAETYQGNEVVEWLTRPIDRITIEIHEAIRNFDRDFVDPTTARTDALDWLAQYHGYTGDYWDATWPTAAKRTLIANAFTEVWPNIGRSSLLEWLLDVFGVRGEYYQPGDFRLNVNFTGDPLAGDALDRYVLLPLDANGYLRTSNEWQLVERLVRLFLPVYGRSTVVYEQFYLDFSVLGDLLME